ncbi:MAG: hypothetical protein V5A56_13330, partial [Halolamina sp.]
MTDEADDDAQAAEQRTPESGDGTPDSEPRENGDESAALTEEADATSADEAAEQTDAEQPQGQVEGSIIERIAAHDESLAVEAREELDAKAQELDAK